MSKKSAIALFLLTVLAFLIPIEHKYDKLFRFYSLTLIPDGLEVSKAYEKKIYFYVSDLIAIILASLAIFWHRVPLKRFFGHPFWLVFLFAFLSILASPFSHYPIPYIRLIQLFTPIALFSYLSTAFDRNEASKICYYLSLAIVAAGTIQALIGIAQYFHQAPLGLRILGETNQFATFGSKTGSRWLIDDLIGYSAKSLDIMRASGTMPHANVFGGFMVLSILSTYMLLMRDGNKSKFFLIPLQFFAMSLSYSRAALFSWAIATFIWIVFTLYQHGFRKIQTISLCIALSLFLSGTLLHKQYFQRGGVINYNGLAKGSDNVRKFHQQKAFSIIQDHPYLGLGYSQFSEGATPYFTESNDAYVRSTAPHNIYLFLACETGLISLTSFLLAIVLLFYSFFKSPITTESITFFSLLIGFLFIGCCDFYPILFQQGKLMFFLTASLLALSTQKRSVESPLIEKTL